ncbi:hypothetical protein BB558_001890 [Smittium angustum]|uniref:30S ribosomal protein S9 n=1 Tax=Smittium angustum TaxID=133377 RepID=A0A2U1IXG9_SMIAN|nr:hypothetical protein BB558_006797 [Smittium angustum]PVZ97509.1 hypothetical protein BB558_006530 [Smittium angustum]PWA01981.1 hypothetical protein BB558_001890 [Smittium angustum]
MEMLFSKKQYSNVMERISQCTRIIQNDENRDEVNKIISYFKSNEVLSKENARRTATLEKANPNGNNETTEAQEQPQKQSKNSLHGYKDEFGRFYALGRRKSSQARVWITPVKNQNTSEESVNTEQTESLPGQIIVNGKSLGEYFDLGYDKESVIFPLDISSSLGKYNVWVKVRGGGRTGQAEAIALSISRAVSVADPDIKPILEKAGCLISDRRVVERKKTGQPKARKKYTWVKR